MEAYLTHYHALDVGFHRLVEHDLRVAHQRALLTHDELQRSEIYHDWFLPNGMRDAIGARTVVGDAQAFVFFHCSSPRDAEYAERSTLLLRLLHPAFEAGVGVWSRLAGQRAALAALVDAIDAGVAVYDRLGRAVHLNRALRELLDAEPEHERLREAVDATVRALVGLAFGAPRAQREERTGIGAREVRTERGAYRVLGSYLGGDLPGPAESIVVNVTPRFAPAPHDGALRERFGLTRQEIRVARLLARGRTNAEIATELGVSAFTARRHTEHVLHKLGVGTRAQVGPALQRA